LRKDYDYDASADLKGGEGLDVDDEYAELSGVVGMSLNGRFNIRPEPCALTLL